MSLMNKMAEEIFDWGWTKGFYTPADLTTRLTQFDIYRMPKGGIILESPVDVQRVQFFTADLMLGKLMLVVSELGEAMESTDDDNLFEEYADAAIRILHIFGGMGRDPAAYIYPLQSKPDPSSSIVHLSRAAEAVRKHETEPFLRALGDTLQVIQYVCGIGNRDLIHEINKKMKVNATRPVRHGKISAV